MYEASTDWGQRHSQLGKSVRRCHLNWAWKVWTLQVEGGAWGWKSQESVGSVRLEKGEQWAEGRLDRHVWIA